ncbi:MAG: PIN domain-containing protein [Deltaproteobacteria bacterium]|nr:PIN domain-containing protein [Deltaproteobacteria bacterium]
MILVDTNAWVDHLRRSDPRLIGFLRSSRAVTCDVVMGELLLGSGMPTDLHELLARLPVVPSPAAAETRFFVERHRRSFRASGVGWADAQIILAAFASGCRIYSSDKSVRAVWRSLGLRLP